MASSKSILKTGSITIAVGLGFRAITGFGQEPPEAGAEFGAVEVIEVVGSRIRRVAGEGPEPVMTISAGDFANLGFSTVQEVLDTLPQNTGGGFDQSFVFGFTPSASAIDVRGFGVGRVLVLLDGRRIPIFPFAASGTDNFVDLNSIPAAAIERIEILPAGASAIYGSDAISGVINIVLRRDVEGTEISARYGDTLDGGGETTRVQLFHGTTTTRSSTSVILEYFELGNIMAGQRAYAANDVLANVMAPTAGPNGNGSVGAFSAYAPAGTLFDYATGLAIAGPECTPNPDNDFIPPGVLDTGGSGTGAAGTAAEGLCQYNRSRYRQLLPDLDRVSAFVQTERELTPSLSFFGRASFSQGSVQTQIEPAPLIFADGFDPIVGCDEATLDAVFGPGTCDAFYDADPNDPRDGIADNPNDISEGLLFLPAVFRRLQEWGPRQSHIDIEQWSALFGLSGRLAARFDWEVGVGRYEIDVQSQERNYAREDLIRPAIASGDWLVFEPASPELVQATRTDPAARGESSITTLDFDITGDAWEMTHGAAQFAAVLEYAEERFSDERDPDLLNNNAIGLGGTAGGGGRKRWALGGEVLLPVLQAVNVHLALRRDEYNDDSAVGAATVPRLAVEYRPTADVLVRGHWGESFRAPDLQRLFGANTRAFLDLIDTPFCLANGGSARGADPTPADGFNECQESVVSVPLLLGSNVALTEEDGEDWGFGAVWEALDDLTVSADFFDVSLEGLVRTPDEQFILDNAASFPGAIQRSPANVTADNPGGLSLVAATAVNIGERRTRGIDFLIEHQRQTTRFGRFDVDVGATYTRLLEEQLAPGEDFLEIAEIPEWRATARMDWESGNWGATVFGYWIDSYAQFAPTDWQQEVSSYVVWNAQFRWRVPWNGVLRAGSNNVFDRKPPADYQNGNAGWPWYNQFYHDPFGRTLFAEYTQEF